MVEKKKIFLVIICGLAGLFFLTARFYIPLIKDNAQRASQYKQLKIELGAIEKFSKDEFSALEQRIDTAISNLEKTFSATGKSKLMEQLTRPPKDTNIAFTNITHKEPLDKQEYQALPLELNLKASFYDLMQYLAEIEASPLLISLDGLNIRKADSETKSLDVKATFLGFRITSEFPSAGKYLEDKYKPFDKQRLETLLEPVKLTDNKSVISDLKDYNPFAYIYQAQPKSASAEPEIKKPDTLYLKGIMHVGGKKVALINDAIVKEGDNIGEMKVLKIQDYKVVLIQSGKEHILKMGVDNEIIKP